MALINQTTKISTSIARRGKLHKPVASLDFFKFQDKNGDWYLQCNTMGSSSRQDKGSVSQSIQIKISDLQYFLTKLQAYNVMVINNGKIVVQQHVLVDNSLFQNTALSQSINCIKK